MDDEDRMTGISSTRFLCVPASDDRESACFEFELPEEVVCRSEVLQTAIDAGEEPVQLLLPQEADFHFFDAWIQLVQARRNRLLLAQSMPMSDVLRGLLAADFFADQQAVLEFCLWLGEHVCSIPRIIRQPPLHALAGSEGIYAVDVDSWKQARREANAEIFEHLPRHLALLVLHSDNVSLSDCAMCLPEALFPIAFEAQHPSAVSAGHVFLDSANVPLQRAEDRMDALRAVGSLSQLTCLTIDSSWLPPGTRDSASLFTRILSIPSLQKLSILGYPTEALGCAFVRCGESIASVNTMSIDTATPISDEDSSLSSLCAVLYTSWDMPCLRDLALSVCLGAPQAACELLPADHVSFDCVIDNLRGLSALTSLKFRVSMDTSQSCENVKCSEIGVGIASTFVNNTLLQCLDVHAIGNAMSPLLRSLPQLQHLTNLALCTDTLQLLVVVPVVCRLLNLQSLRLAGCVYELNEYVEFSGMSRLNQLTNLHLVGARRMLSNRYSHPTSFWRTFSCVLVSMASIQRLCLDSWHLESSLYMISGVLGKLSSLSCLEIVRCVVSEQCVRSLKQGVTCMPALTCLSLEGNPLTVKGARVVLECLEDMPQLRKLNLQRCGISSEGCERARLVWESVFGNDRNRTLCVDG